MRARIFSVCSWVGDVVLVSDAGIEGEEVEGDDEGGKVERCRVREGRGSSLRRAIALRDMAPLG
jgi:hypothetical protein